AGVTRRHPNAERLAIRGEPQRRTSGVMPSQGRLSDPLPLSIIPVSFNATRRPRLGQSVSWRVAVGPGRTRRGRGANRPSRRDREQTAGWSGKVETVGIEPTSAIAHEV